MSGPAPGRAREGEAGTVARRRVRRLGRRHPAERGLDPRRVRGGGAGRRSGDRAVPRVLADHPGAGGGRRAGRVVGRGGHGAGLRGLRGAAGPRSDRRGGDGVRLRLGRGGCRGRHPGRRARRPAAAGAGMDTAPDGRADDPRARGGRRRPAPQHPAPAPPRWRRPLPARSSSASTAAGSTRCSSTCGAHSCPRPERCRCTSPRACGAPSSRFHRSAACASSSTTRSTPRPSGSGPCSAAISWSSPTRSCSAGSTPAPPTRSRRRRAFPAPCWTSTSGRRAGACTCGTIPTRWTPPSGPTGRASVVHLEPRPDVTGTPKKAAERLLRNWRARVAAQEASARLVNSLLPGPCDPPRSSARGPPGRHAARRAPHHPAAIRAPRHGPSSRATASHGGPRARPRRRRGGRERRRARTVPAAARGTGAGWSPPRAERPCWPALALVLAGGVPNAVAVAVAVIGVLVAVALLVPAGVRALARHPSLLLIAAFLGLAVLWLDAGVRHAGQLPDGLIGGAPRGGIPYPFVLGQYLSVPRAHPRERVAVAGRAPLAAAARRHLARRRRRPGARRRRGPTPARHHVAHSGAPRAVADPHRGAEPAGLDRLADGARRAPHPARGGPGDRPRRPLRGRPRRPAGARAHRRPGAARRSSSAARCWSDR